MLAACLMVSLGSLCGDSVVCGSQHSLLCGITTEMVSIDTSKQKDGRGYP